jgi:AcrR family transcriptional regulator
MMELLLEKRFDAIIVQDLLDRAGIGRSTFYAHYFDKDDVLAQIAEQMLETFRMRVAQENARHPGEHARQAGDAGTAEQAAQAAQAILPSLEIFRHVQQQYPQLHALVRGHAGEVLWETGQALLRQNIERTLITTYTRSATQTGPPSVPVEVVAQYLAGAFLNLLTWWLRAEMPYTADQMDSFFQQLALPGVWETWATVEKNRT